MTAADFPDPVYDVTCSCGRKWFSGERLDLDTAETVMCDEAMEHDALGHTLSSRAYGWRGQVMALATIDAARLREMRAARRPAATDSADQPRRECPWVGGTAQRLSGRRPMSGELSVMAETLRAAGYLVNQSARVQQDGRSWQAHTEDAVDHVRRR